VVDAGPALLEEARDRGLRVGRLEQLEPGFAAADHRHPHLLLRDLFHRADLEPERLVEARASAIERTAMPRWSTLRIIAPPRARPTRAASARTTPSNSVSASR